MATVLVAGGDQVWVAVVVEIAPSAAVPAVQNFQRRQRRVVLVRRVVHVEQPIEVVTGNVGGGRHIREARLRTGGDARQAQELDVRTSKTHADLPCGAPAGGDWCSAATVCQPRVRRSPRATTVEDPDSRARGSRAPVPEPAVKLSVPSRLRARPPLTSRALAHPMRTTLLTVALARRVAPLAAPLTTRQPASSAAATLESFAALDGAWAGWQCEFDGATGALRPVPDRYLPEALIEWGQAPEGFELLAAEAVDAGAEPTLARRFLRVLPEEGCAVDDLAAEHSRSALALRLGGPAALRGGGADEAALAGCAEARAFALDGPSSAPSAWHLRTVFADAPQRRVRVTLRFDGAAAAVRGAVRVAVERRIDGEELRALNGGAADGFGARWPDRGTRRTGIDARALTAAIGARCFAAKRGGGAGPAPPAAGGLLLPPGVRVRAFEHGVEVALADEAGASERVVRREFDPATGDLRDVVFASQAT